MSLPPVLSFDNLDQLAAASPDDITPADVPAGDNTGQLLPQTSQVQWNIQGVQPPSNLYIQLNDQIQLTFWNGNSVVTEVDVSGRLLLPDGSIKQIFFAIQCAAFKLPGTFTFALAEGFLLDIIATTPTAGIQRGDIFVQLAIIRGAQANPLLGHVLIQDYVWTQSIAQWPGSPVRDPREGPGSTTDSLVLPLAGADWHFTVTSNLRARVLHISAVILTSAAVANRIVALYISNPAGNIQYGVEAQANVTAGQSRRFNWSPGNAMYTPFFAHFGMPIPEPTILEAGYKISTITTNLQAGDQWQQVNLLTEQWISPS